MNKISIPKEDGEVLLSTSLGELPHLIEQNRKLFTASDLQFDGTSLDDQRKYIRKYLGIEGPIIASGHQPEFYGPGPFFKELVLDYLSSQCSCLNFLVDTDSTQEISFDIPLISGGSQDRKSVV